MTIQSNEAALDNQAPQLIGMPYIAPKARPGSWLDDEIDGAVQVGGWSNGRIPWPRRKKTGAHSLILCGDLARAVKTESSKAVQFWFGVGSTTVYKWRLALGVERMDALGTVELYKKLLPKKLPADVAAKGRKAAKTPESIEKMAASKRGKPAHPNTQAALDTGRRKPKPEGWGARANAWMLEGKYG